MSSIDKISVRDKVEQLKADFASLNDSNNLSSETKALILGLLTLIDMMLVIFMEKKTAKKVDFKIANKRPKNTLDRVMEKLYK